MIGEYADAVQAAQKKSMLISLKKWQEIPRREGMVALMTEQAGCSRAEQVWAKLDLKTEILYSIAALQYNNWAPLRDFRASAGIGTRYFICGCLVKSLWPGKGGIKMAVEYTPRRS